METWHLRSLCSSPLCTHFMQGHCVLNGDMAIQARTLLTECTKCTRLHEAVLPACGLSTWHSSGVSHAPYMHKQQVDCRPAACRRSTSSVHLMTLMCMERRRRHCRPALCVIARKCGQLRGLLLQRIPGQPDPPLIPHLPHPHVRLRLRLPGPGGDPHPPAAHRRHHHPGLGGTRQPVWQRQLVACKQGQVFVWSSQSVNALRDSCYHLPLQWLSCFAPA